MATTVTKRRCKMTAPISVSTWVANKLPSAARAYLDGLSYTIDVPIVDSKRNVSGDESDSTNSQSDKYTEHEYGHITADGSITLQFDAYNRPPLFTVDEIRAMIIYLNLDGSDAMVTTPGSENVMFIGFIKIGGKDQSEPQHGVMPVTLKVKNHGFFAGDIEA